MHRNSCVAFFVCGNVYCAEMYMCIFIHSFNKHLLSTYCGPGTVIDEDIKVNPGTCFLSSRGQQSSIHMHVYVCISVSMCLSRSMCMPICVYIHICVLVKVYRVLRKDKDKQEQKLQSKKCSRTSDLSGKVKYSQNPRITRGSKGQTRDVGGSSQGGTLDCIPQNLSR